MTRREKFRQRFAAFRARFIANISKVRPKVALRILGAIVIFFPWMLFSFLSSLRKLSRWRKVGTCQALIRRNALAFEGIEIDSLTVDSVSGGISNSNEIWR